MKKIVFLLIISPLIFNCSGDEDEPNLTVSAIADLVIDDITNNGDASDVELTFSALSDEEGLESYRFFLVKTTKAGSFSKTTAQGLSDNFLDIAKAGSNHKIVLQTSTTDTDGEAIAEDISYTGFILSVGVEGVSDVLSEASNALILKQSSIKITYIGNDGVHISDGSKSVIIDALPGDLSGWSPIADGIQGELENGDDRFDNIMAAMVTHAHGDHVSSASINRFLNANSSAKVILPAGLHGSITNSAQISDLDPARGEAVTVDFDGITVKVLHLRHFDLFGNDFSGVDNYGYLVEIGGLKVLHLGDVFYSTENFEPFDLAAEQIDVLLLPTFDALVSTANKTIIEEQIEPANIIGLHLPTSTSISFVANIYPDARVFKTSMEFERY